MTCRENLKFLLSHFDLSTAKLCIKIKGGGWVKISDFAVGKGEQVKFLSPEPPHSLASTAFTGFRPAFFKKLAATR